MPFWLDRSTKRIGMHVDQVVPALARADLLDHHGQRVRQFVADAFQRGLADQLGHQDFLRLVGELPIGIERRARRQLACEHADQHVDLFAGRRRDRHDLGLRSDQFAGRHQLSGHLIPGHLVDLGDDGHQRGLGRHCADLFTDPPVPRPDRLVGGNAQADDVDLRIGVADQIIEPLAQQGPWPVQTGGVDEDDLELVAVHDSANRVARGLRAVGRDRHLGTDERVHQRRLTRVRPSDETDEAGTEFAHRGVPARSVTMTLASPDSSRTAATPASSADPPTSTAASRPVAPLDTAAATAA